MKKFGFIIISLVLIVGCGGPGVQEVIDDGPFEAEWESLQGHDDPEWFMDAKFGIYTHWGVYSVPEFGNEWYPKWMYAKGYEHRVRGNYYDHHVKTYGDPLKFGYKDLVPMFKAEKFDADEWAQLFKDSGAKFAGPVGEHHDGFSMWDSDVNAWNAMDMGPRRDIVGELGKAVKSREMKYIVSLHHARKWWFYEPSYDLGDGVDTRDVRYAGPGKIYPTPHKQAPGYQKIGGDAPDDAYMEEWLAKTIEVIDKYDPDILWFDSGLAKEKFWRGRTEEFNEYKKEFMAYYYNKAAKDGKEVVVNYKHEDFPKGSAIIDIERGRMDTLTDYPWLTDTAVGMKSWSYVKNPKYKNTDALIDVLVDIVSKNGCLLLNIGPKPDGSIPVEMKETLLGMGRWLEINGEGIYGTRPWKKYGEGPTGYEGGHFKESQESIYVAEDIRFTTKGDVLYAIALDWPGEEMVIKSLRANEKAFGDIKEIRMLGHEGKLEFSREVDGLVVKMPDSKPCANAFTVKIVLK
ncbi:MAG: alpha-L-fucosidase [Phycisphaerae bacterium]|nr:alpha-L-fucosidase [Phycisphaerae bacterium]